MAFPDGILADDEHVLIHRHPHWKMLVVPAAIFLLATLVVGYALGAGEHHLVGQTRTGVRIAILVLWAVVVVWRCVAPLARWRSTHFVVTSRRVLVREGVLTHTGIDIALSRISDVRVRRGVSDRMLGTGTLVLSSAADDPLEFEDIPHVEEVHSLLYREVSDPGAPLDRR